MCPDLIAVGAQGRVHNVQRVTGAWTEAGVTWNNQPPVAVTVTDSVVIIAGLTCASFTVTGDVQAWVDGAANYGWQLSDADENTNAAELRYGARENANATILPRLQISYQ